MEDSILTAEAVVDRIDGAATSGGVGAAWATVGGGGRIATVAGAVAATAAAAVWVPDTSAAVATGLGVLVLVAAALVDAVEHRLPNALVGVAAVPVLGAMAVAWVTGGTPVVAGALAGAALVGGPLLVTHSRRPPEWASATSRPAPSSAQRSVSSAPRSPCSPLLFGLSGAAGWAVAGRRRTIALGPGLVAGAVLALVVAWWMNVEANG